MWRFLSSMFSAKSVGRSGNKRFGLYKYGKHWFRRQSVATQTSRINPPGCFFFRRILPRETSSPANVVNPGNRPPRNRRMRLIPHMLGTCVPLSQFGFHSIWWCCIFLVQKICGDTRKIWLPKLTPNTCFGWCFTFYHGIHQHVSPPFGDFCCFFPSTQQANQSKWRFIRIHY